MQDPLRDLLLAVSRGELSIDDAVGEVVRLREDDLGFARIDHERAARTGQSEVVLGEGKTADQIRAIAASLADRGHPVLVTRIRASVAESLPELRYEAVPRLLWSAPDGVDPFVRRVDCAPVWVVSGGTSDMPVAEEAARCAEFMGLPIERSYDVGVAGLHRLLSRLDGLREASCIIAVAGMEGALPSVVAGLVSVPVIAVPTSVGYGTQLGGLTPLFAMLTSCASGVAVVNIDNGFGAACVARRMLT